MAKVQTLERVESVPGWFHHGAKILELVEQHRPMVCVELGTWLGASAIPVARAIQRWGGTLTCVDTWAGDVRQASTAAPWMLVSCVRNLIDAGVNANVRLIPAMSRDVVAYWSTAIDYLYVDADHSYEAVTTDLHTWLPHVKPGGLILGDDYDHPLFPGVAQAWDELEQARGLTLTRYQSDPPDPDGIRLVYGTV